MIDKSFFEEYQHHCFTLVDIENADSLRRRYAMKGKWGDYHRKYKEPSRKSPMRVKLKFRKGPTREVKVKKKKKKANTAIKNNAVELNSSSNGGG